MFAINLFLLIAIVAINFSVIKSGSHVKYDINQRLPDKICIPLHKFLQLTEAHSETSRQPKVVGFRAECSRSSISVDETGLTVIPNNRAVTLRLFGVNLGAADNYMQIGFTTVEGQTDDKCDPSVVFSVNRAVNDGMALADIQLSETIADKPYFICLSTTDSNDNNKHLANAGKIAGLALWAKKRTSFYYLSSDQSLKVRVIGRKIIAVREGDDKNYANLKARLAQIVDETNKIHRIADEMQEW